MRAASRLLLVLAACLLAPSAQAAITRYAVIAGNDAGAPGELTLRYAESDARKVYDVLRGLGEFLPENMLLLQGRGGGELARVLISLNARIRAESSAGRDSILFVYYSGHADASALHTGAELLELELLQRLVQGSPADFRVLVLDACRSGSLTRVKGAQKAAPFPVRLEPELSGEGLALLTSSTSDEDAQESDALKGSFFTHYLVSGLRGAADRNADGSISLEEAYGYAYQHTLRASSQTVYGTQHPTFRFDLRGKGSVPLTRVAPRDGGAQMAFPPGHAYLLFAGDEQGPVVAEVGENDTRTPSRCWPSPPSGSPSAPANISEPADSMECRVELPHKAAARPLHPHAGSRPCVERPAVEGRSTRRTQSCSRTDTSSRYRSTPAAGPSR